MGYRQTPDQIREHYVVERELAERLRSAGKAERRWLYAAVYDELFARVPHHPQIAQALDEQGSAREARRELALLNRYLRPSDVFLEIGPGDCHLALAVAKRVQRVIAVDVSDAVAQAIPTSANFEFVVSDGTSIPVPDGSVDIAYSRHVLEHLHPDDVSDHLAEVYRALAPGGRYVCITPSRLSGPHDVSRHFDRVATGLHLHEYSITELDALLRAGGFVRVAVIVGSRGWFLPVRFAPAPFRWLERVLAPLPYPLRRAVARFPPIRVVLGVRLVAHKPAQ